MKKIRLSLISWMHYVKLVLRSILFLLVLVFYILGNLDYDPEAKCDHHDHHHGEGHTCGDHGCRNHSCH